MSLTFKCAAAAATADLQKAQERNVQVEASLARTTALLKEAQEKLANEREDNKVSISVVAMAPHHHNADPQATSPAPAWLKP